jgi:hypothetical protein
VGRQAQTVEYDFWSFVGLQFIEIWRGCNGIRGKLVGRLANIISRWRLRRLSAEDLLARADPSKKKCPTPRSVGPVYFSQKLKTIA